jgi:hypothetical protein
VNNSRIKNTKVEKLWEFPPLSDGKQGRVFTKHFTNLPFMLDPNHYTLLFWLVYQSNADNTVRYNTALLKQYEATVRVTAGSRGERQLMSSIPILRNNFEWLIKNSFLLPTNEDKVFMINPNLTYSRLYVKGEFYKQWVKSYQTYFPQNPKGLLPLSQSYLDHVNNNYKKRKKHL